MRTLAFLIAGLMATTAAADSRRDWDGSLLLHGTLRSATSQPGDETPPAGFSTGFPYFGASAAIDAYPLRGGLLERFGLGVGYTFSTASLEVTGGGLPDRTLAAREQRFHFEFLAREPRPLAGLHLAARVGLAMNAFSLEQHGSLAPSTHAALRIAVDVRREFGPVEARLVAGVRLGSPGEELERQLRLEGSAIGFDARLLLSGSLGSLAKDLAWTAGWDWVRLSSGDENGRPSGTHVESYHRLLVGLSWRPARLF